MCSSDLLRGAAGSRRRLWGLGRNAGDEQRASRERQKNPHYRVYSKSRSTVSVGLENCSGSGGSTRVASTARCALISSAA